MQTSRPLFAAKRPAMAWASILMVAYLLVVICSVASAEAKEQPIEADGDAAALRAWPGGALAPVSAPGPALTAQSTGNKAAPSAGEGRAAMGDGREGAPAVGDCQRRAGAGASCSAQMRRVSLAVLVAPTLVLLLLAL